MGRGDHLALAEMLVEEAFVALTLDRYPEAAERCQEALDVLAPVLDASHMTVLRIRAELLRALMMSGQAKNAVALGQALLADHERVLGADHPSTLAALTEARVGAQIRRRLSLRAPATRGNRRAEPRGAA